MKNLFIISAQHILFSCPVQQPKSTFCVYVWANVHKKKSVITCLKTHYIFMDLWHFILYSYQISYVHDSKFLKWNRFVNAISILLCTFLNERFIHSSCNIDNKKIKFSQHVKMLLLTEYKLRLSALYYQLVQNNGHI